MSGDPFEGALHVVQMGRKIMTIQRLIMGTARLTVQRVDSLTPNTYDDGW